MKRPRNKYDQNWDNEPEQKSMETINKNYGHQEPNQTIQYDLDLKFKVGYKPKKNICLPLKSCISGIWCATTPTNVFSEWHRKNTKGKHLKLDGVGPVDNRPSTN